ncbi:twitching motility protein PilT [Actibacterium mucosum KCTC 23349]|uniref:Twitching motility protein PilT n=1 Tax=Actibacterium mucosum KCTC 23349 TaxID=1454373 RepID=A0A037ZFV0_9RHOB|nr:DUF1761 family protein [Actibacterium mucosum]KAJ54478.1 twitching motility protein PilT [Actibacterium mucosum KCTC 23349]
MINWAAFGAGVVGAFILGYIVYGPFLGLQRRWAEGTRINPEPPASPPLAPMAAQITALALLALVIAMTETTQALNTALVAILAVIAQTVSVGVWAQKSRFAVTVDAGYALGCGVVMILAHAIL